MAENLGVKHADWDKKDGYYVPEDRNLYNSYIYDAHNPNTSILDKIAMQGKKISENIRQKPSSHNDRSLILEIQCLLIHLIIIC